MIVNRISSKPTSFRQYFLGLLSNRSLIAVFVKRDLKIRYAQTLLGILWAVIQPIIAALIYTVFFYMILKLNTGTIPYPLFVLPGIMAWFHFTTIIDEAGTALMHNQELIRKVNFPKMILPISKLISSLTDVFITLILIFILMLIYSYPITWRIVFFPVFLLLNILCGFSIALCLSSLTIRYRDFHHIIPFLISFGIWITPVFYPTTIVPEALDKYIYFNPIAGILAGYRWSILSTDFPNWKYLLGYIPVIILLLTGVRYFLKIENEIVDHI